MRKSLSKLWEEFITLILLNFPKRKFSATQVYFMEAWWPHGQCAHLRNERSGLKPWPGTLFCGLKQDTLHHKFYCWGYLSIVVTHPGESRNIPSRFMPLKLDMGDCLMGHVARMQTLFTALPDLCSLHPWSYIIQQHSNK